jgi:hypothetical protein
MAIHAVLAPNEAVGFVDIHVVVTEFAVEIVEAVHARFVLLEPVSVAAIFAVVRMRNEITIF